MRLRSQPTFFGTDKSYSSIAISLNWFCFIDVCFTEICIYPMRWFPFSQSFTQFAPLVLSGNGIPQKKNGPNSPIIIEASLIFLDHQNQLSDSFIFSPANIVQEYFSLCTIYEPKLDKIIVLYVEKSLHISVQSIPM